MFCSALCKFSVYGLILSITFDQERFILSWFDIEGGLIALWNFVFFQSHRFFGLFTVSSFKGFHVCV